ncbi:MAG: Gfo/Idh/MocA family oxidoreductase [Planctomycetaceae bacterium]|nr:Gfo/Idh/MocA family oxidoreductase [Planctomycetaceae bacterium]
MTYGVLLIGGAQTHQENYARGFAADPRCRLMGLADDTGIPLRRQELNAELAAELQIPLLADLEAALARSDVHLACICAEPERRGALAVRAARAGKHVYLDKEPASTIAGGREVAKAVKDAGVLSQTFSLVRSPVGRKARQIVDSGRLGKLVAIHSEMFFAKGMSGTADVSTPRRESADVPRLTFLDSKRELLCVGWYPLVLFQWLLGDPPERVGATTSNYFFHEHQKNGVEDFANLLLEYPGGVQGSITVGRTGWKSHPSHGVHRVHLVGTEGIETIDAFEPRVEIFSDAPDWRPPAVPHPEDPMGFWSSTNQQSGVRPKTVWHPIDAVSPSEFSHFIDCIEQGRESDVSAALAADVLATIFSAYAAAARGVLVALAR